MADESILGRLTLPTTPGAPVTVVWKHPALRLAVVERDGVIALPDEWDVAGVYILLGLASVFHGMAVDGAGGCWGGGTWFSVGRRAA